jgi:hypothetical protein
MTENANVPAENAPAATVDETLLSQTQRDMLTLIRDSVSEAERVAPKKEKRTVEAILIDLVLNGTDEDVKGLDKFREILRAKSSDIFAQENSTDGENISDDERKRIRTEAKTRYDSAKNVLGMFPLPEGFVVPDFPGARGGSNSGAGLGGEKPRNLKHTVTKDGDSEPMVKDVTFAVIAQKTKESTADLLAQFKSVAGESKDDWSKGSGSWEWSFRTGEGENITEYNVVTTYDAPAAKPSE